MTKGRLLFAGTFAVSLWKLTLILDRNLSLLYHLDNNDDDLVIKMLGAFTIDLSLKTHGI